MPTIKSIRATFGRNRSNKTLGDDAPERDGSQAEGIASLQDQRTKIRGVNSPDNARFWLAAIADSCDDAIVGRDLDGLVTSWNKAAETMFGYSAEEIMGQPITRIIPPVRIDDELSILVRIRRGEKINNFETRRQCKDGRVIPVSLTVSPIRDERGRIIGVSKTCRALSETQRAHRDLERRETLLRSILDTVPDALIVIDEKGLIHSFSVAAARLFNYTAVEMIGRNISTLLPSSNSEQHQAAAGYAATNDRRIVGFGQRRDGSTFPMELKIGEIRLPATPLFAAFVHDLTQPAEHERELRAINTELERQARHLVTARDAADRSSWAKSRFLSFMGHELSTPVNNIVGYAQSIPAEGDLNPAQGQQVEAILDTGKHLQQIIDCVLDLSQIEAEPIELQATEVDVVTVATTCVDLVRPAAEAKDLALSMIVAPDMRHELVTDPIRLRQILHHLLNNAVQFTSRGGIELSVRPAADGSMLRIEVADTGHGISINERRRLLREFERLDVEDSHSVEGTGPGLALSSRLMTLLGGRLGHHDNPGGGSVFWLELPTETVAASPVLADVPASPPVVLHVLIVDDVAMNRDIAGSFLRSAGHRVTAVDGGAEAIEAVKVTDFDVVLMDVRMPEMDGLEATRRIRAIEGRRGRVPIVALTARAFTEQVAECRAAGMNSHLPKPFDPDSLLTAVLRACTTAAAPIAVPIVEPAEQVVGSELVVCNASAFERTAFYLEPKVVTSYLETIAERGEILLRGLQEADALMRTGDELAEAAHTIAGSAGMFGFERLTTVGRRFERAVQAGAADAPAISDGLSAALEITIRAIHDRMLVVAEG